MDDIRNPSPLAFDRVMEGKPISAHTSPLFKIPVEILTTIVRQLRTSKRDLSSLALVNTDCRQLARSCQFCTIKLDGSPLSENLLRLLQREAFERGQNHGLTRSLSLGACIRRVVTNNNGYWKEVIASRPLKPGRTIDDNLGDPYDDNEEKIAQWRPTVGELTNRLNENYRPNVLFVVSSLIHLESLEIAQADWNQMLMNTLVALPVKYLSLGDVQMTDVIPIMDEVEWPLERLKIGLSWDFDFGRHTDKSVFNSSKSWETVLRPCSAFLQVLTLSHSAIIGLGLKEDPVSFVLEFPKLRQLHLLWESHLGPLALKSLILTSPNLKNLAINYGNKDTRELLDREGYIESLKTLIMNHAFGDKTEDASLDFLKNNLQLEALGFYCSESYTLLERVLQLLINFKQMKMLSMTWDGPGIPQSSLDALSALTSLEAIHLSSGFQVGWRNDWQICHHDIIASLKPLSGLKRIAFTREAYSYTQNGFTNEYNSSKHLRIDAWDLHCQHMREKALDYTNTFPRLELLHIGELTFQISRVDKNVKLLAFDDEGFSWETSILNMRPY